MSIGKEAVEQHRPCPFHGCNRPVRDAMFACQTHWFLLEAWERQEIARAMRQWRAKEIDDGELRRRHQEVLGRRGTA
jgi:hypothetical protein